MAQVTGGSDYDFMWDEKLEAGTLLLQDFSDSVAANENVSESDELVVSAILKLFSLFRPKRRKLREWQEVIKPIRDELKNLRENATEADLNSVERELRQLIEKAIEGWKEGNPEIPRTDVVLNKMVAILFKHRFIKNPPYPGVG